MILECFEGAASHWGPQFYQINFVTFITFKVEYYQV